MALTVRLDAETDRCLRELQAESGLHRSALIRQLISERLGGPPPEFLSTLPPGGSEREPRRQSVLEHVQRRQRQRSGCDASRSMRASC